MEYHLAKRGLSLPLPPWPLSAIVDVRAGSAIVTLQCNHQDRNEGHQLLELVQRMVARGLLHGYGFEAVNSMQDSSPSVSEKSPRGDALPSTGATLSEMNGAASPTELDTDRSPLEQRSSFKDAALPPWLQGSTKKSSPQRPADPSPQVANCDMGR